MSIHFSVKNLIDLQEEVNKKINDLKIYNYKPNIIAVSKTFPIEKIKPLIDYGHIHFGENKVQEAVEKWTGIKEKNPKINLHMIGKLQSNKVKFAVKIFDYIHSVDSIKLVKKIAEEQTKLNKKLKIFIQANLNNEDQKSGISKDLVDDLYESCVEYNLDVLGLMCLPPIDKPPGEFFLMLKRKKDELKLTSLSMGMSNDYLEAIVHNSNFLRIGSKIFGSRD